MIYEKGRKSNRNIEPLRFVVVSGLCLREFQKKRPDWEVRQMGLGILGSSNLYGVAESFLTQLV